MLYGAGLSMVVNDLVPQPAVQTFLAMVVHGLVIQALAGLPKAGHGTTRAA